MRKQLLIYLLLFVLALTGCQTAAEKGKSGGELRYEPELPDTIRVDEKGVPLLDVYVVDEQKVSQMDIETYLCGVLAGEMKNDWPMEALKAQAILARTFVIRFLSEKQSKYENADISTDVSEAQAYNASGVNDRIRQAVSQTRGQIVCYESEPIYAWFHAHSGGMTADAKEGLSYKEEAPYTQSVRSRESEAADPQAQEWTADFSAEEVKAAAQACGVKIDEAIHSVAMGAMGASGRVQTLRINGTEVPANELRIALGSTQMRSTMLSSVSLWDGRIVFKGKGYGHGVGMSQWGARAMAEEGKTAKEIIHYYFRNVDIVQKWK